VGSRRVSMPASSSQLRSEPKPAFLQRRYRA
jgi:hypothetical protein